MNKEGKFLKKPCCGVGGSVYQGKLVLSTEFKTKISHRSQKADVSSNSPSSERLEEL